MSWTRRLFYFFFIFMILWNYPTTYLSLVKNVALIVLWTWCYEILFIIHIISMADADSSRFNFLMRNVISWARRNFNMWPRTVLPKTLWPLTIRVVNIIMIWSWTLINLTLTHVPKSDRLARTLLSQISVIISRAWTLFLRFLLVIFLSYCDSRILTFRIIKVCIWSIIVFATHIALFYWDYGTLSFQNIIINIVCTRSWVPELFTLLLSHVYFVRTRRLF